MELSVKEGRTIDREARLRRIVDAVVDLPPSDWERAIELLTRGDPELARAVQRAVSPDEQATLAMALAEKRGEGFANERRAELGERGEVGSYRLLERLGEGAFGEVYVAEQSEPVRRKVAIKLLKPGMGSRQVIARFEAERQALAIMDHPHIAKIFDAGSTPLGLPYFVMELVRGAPITTFCTEHRLSLRERLALLIPVCEAVHHAHQRGIIHRDLKPGNVLVTVLDGKPVPKVIDFGIAKALGPRLTDSTIYTQFRQFIGTPAYMSPEQMALSAVDVDTRSDVYSLGAMMYELVSGSPPFDADTLLKAGLDELRRVVRETDPPKPSTRVGTIDAGSRLTLATAMKVPAERLRGQLEGEVDWIATKATERERGRRYQSPLEMASDLSAFLSGGTVTAGPRSRVYLARKFARRNRVPLAVVSSAMMGLTATAIGTGIGLARETAAREAAVRNERAAQANEKRALESEAAALADRKKAERSDRISKAALDMFPWILQGAISGDQDGRKDVTVAEMCDRTVQALDRGLDPSGNAIEPEVAQILQRTMAWIYFWTGRVQEGRALAERVYSEAQSRFSPDSMEFANALALMVSAHWFSGTGNSPEGEQFARRQIALLEKLGETQTPEYFEAVRSLGLMFSSQRRHADALEIVQRQAREYDAMSAPPAESWQVSYNDIALHSLNLGRAQAALNAADRAIEIIRNHMPGENAKRHRAIALATRASILVALGRAEEAESDARKAVDETERLFGEDHAQTRYCRRALFRALITLGRLQEADELNTAYERSFTTPPQGMEALLTTLRRAEIDRRAGRQAAACEALSKLVQGLGEPGSLLPPGDPIRALIHRELLGNLTDLRRPRDGLPAADRAWNACRQELARTGDDRPESTILRPFAAELLRALEMSGDHESLVRAASLREQFPGLVPAPGFPPSAPPSIDPAAK